MKRLSVALAAMMALGASAQQPPAAADPRYEVAALRNDMARLVEYQNQLRARIEELQAGNGAAAMAVKVQALERKVASLEQALAEQRQALAEQKQTTAAALAAEARARQQTADQLITKVSAEVAGAGRGSSSGAGRTSNVPKVDPGYELKEIEVQKGDSLSTIAVAAGTTIDKIKQANGLSSNTLRVGQKLKVPVKK